VPSTGFSPLTQHLEHDDGYEARDYCLNEPEKEIAQENGKAKCCEQGESVKLNLCYSDENNEEQISADNLESGL
jgi:hypothetical protein